MGEAHETRAFADLVEELAAGTRCLIGDTGYDADWLRQELLLRGVLPVIPPHPVRQAGGRSRSAASCTGCGTGSSGW